MEKSRFLLIAVMLMLGLCASAQKREAKAKAVFEEATAREAYPNVAVFVFPQICDLKMISTERVEYGPFEFPLSKDLSSMNEAELTNDKTRALQQACQLDGADLIIEPLYTTTVYEKDNKTLVIKLSGYPAKYVNFRSLKPEDMKMIETLYPHGVEGIQKQNEGRVVTTSSEGAK
ncbi:MAG: hypothetical protein NC102_09090 [Clostridium sp.]|nr:hypothetical protein [Clostridium sp.]